MRVRAETGAVTGELRVAMRASTMTEAQLSDALVRPVAIAVLQKPSGPLARNHGHWIIFAACGGLVLSASLMALVALACGYWWDKKFWIGAAANPPWVLFTGVAAAPAVLLTWYWRTIQRTWELSLQHAQRVHDEAQLQHALETAQVAARTAAFAAFQRDVDQLLSNDLGATADAVERALEIATAFPGLRRPLARRLAGFIRDAKNMRPKGGPGLVSYKEALTSALHAITALHALVDDLRVDLSGADLSELDLRGVNFAGATLTGVSLSHADLGSALGLDGLMLFSVSVADAIYDAGELDEYTLEMLRSAGAVSRDDVNNEVDRAIAELGLDQIMTDTTTSPDAAAPASSSAPAPDQKAK